MTSAPPLSVGLCGAGRTRDGLGPFLAAFLEAAGARVTAVCGRNLDRAEIAAAELSAQLGHEVAAQGDVAALCRSGIDALAIASPAEHHLEALVAAADAGLHALCEKPLVNLEQTAAAVAVIERFLGAGRVLVENCQWPFTLPALWQLFPGAEGEPVEEVAMGLGPAHPGRAMVEDSLSHFLSVLQAVVPVDASTVVRAVRLTELPAERLTRVLELRIAEPFPALRGRLELTLCPQQPRPAWVAVNGHRMDRVLGADYSMSFRGGERQVPIDDPMRSLVYGFVQLTGRLPVDRIRRQTCSIAQRLRLYRDIVGRC